MAAFLASLARDDLAPATLRGYRYDLRQFVAWHRTVHDGPFVLGHLAGHELTAYRQHMVAGGLRPATVNAGSTPCQPAGLTDSEVHALLHAVGASSHGLAERNYALVQLMLQAGLRVGEVAALQAGHATLGDRSSTVRIRHGKGLKARDAPLNATARRALRQHLGRCPAPDVGVALEPDACGPGRGCRVPGGRPSLPLRRPTLPLARTAASSTTTAKPR